MHSVVFSFSFAVCIDLLAFVCQYQTNDTAFLRIRSYLFYLYRYYRSFLLLLYLSTVFFGFVVLNTYAFL